MLMVPHLFLRLFRHMKAMTMQRSRRTMPAEAPAIASTGKNVFPGNRGVDEVVFELWKKGIIMCLLLR